MNTITLTEADLAQIVAKAVAQGVADALAQNTAPEADAKPAQEPAPAKDESFVEYLRTTAEARKARKGANAETSAWLKSKGLPLNGEVWALAKAGVRDVRKLKAAAKRDAKARAAERKA